MAKPKSLESLLTTLSTKTDDQYKDLDKRLDNIEKVMIAQEINLKNHMMRSEHLETIVQAIQEKELKPIQKHVAHVEGALKLFGIISLLVGIIAAFFNIFT